jgi:hypothetical protein
MKEAPKNYHQQKMNFLDEIHPDDLRNGESFNQLEQIIDNINQAFHTKTTTSDNSNIFLTKSLATLFRENSPAIDKSEELAQVYLQEKLGGRKIGGD